MTASAGASTAAAPATGRIPDFFIVGHAKSGTTALYEMLRRHPQIFMPELKETRYFARELHAPLRQSSAHPDTLADYLSLFAAARPEQRVGEASPSYLRSPATAGRIAQLRPDSRIVAILREPAEFLRSLHLQLLQAHVETERDLRRAIELEPRRRAERATDPSIQQGLLYSEHVRYADQLRSYHAVFAPEQVLVLIYDDFLADNEATVRKVLRFLEVDDTAALEVVEANPTVRVRSPSLHRLARSLYMGEGPAARSVKAAIKTFTAQPLRREALAVLHRTQWARPRAADEDLMLELRQRFKEEVIAASEYLGRDLVALWGYDRIS